MNAVEVFEDWLDGYLNFERTPKKDIFWLDTIDYLCKRFDNPQDCAPCFHVAGSKGKGSVSRMISCILEQAGYSVGIYSSPHILDFRERISKPNSFFDEAIYEETVRELVPKIEKENWFDYDVIVATPDMMGIIGRLGKVLGPKGLMPNPKSGTVTMDVTKAIEEIKSGKVEYRLDKTNIIHLGIGKISFGAEKLEENYKVIIEAIIKAKPAAAKGQYLRSIAVASTMGPGVKINPAKISE